MSEHIDRSECAGEAPEADTDSDDCTCGRYVVDYSDPERYHPENVDRELDPACPRHGGAERMALAEWNLDDDEIQSVRDAMREAGAWQLIELTMDTIDRSPSVETVDQARKDITALLAAHDAEVERKVAERIAVAILGMPLGHAVEVQGAYMDWLQDAPEQVRANAARAARAETDQRG